MIVGVTPVMQHIAVLNAIVIQLAEDLLRRDAQIDAQVVHQGQFALLVDTRKQRHFGVGRAALHQRATGVIADPANHRRANTG